MDYETDCQCACGKTQFRLHGSPLIRAYCHCTICQQFSGAAFADISVFRPRDVEMPPAGQVEFRTYRPPPAVQRGNCVDCGKPALEMMNIVALPKMILVPTNNIAERGSLPEASLHVFYNSRVADADDDLPKYSGYWRSQFVFCRKLIAAMVRSNR